MNFKVDPSIFRVRMFSNLGYKRQKCLKCGSYFWSIKDRNDCNDSPCTDYTFFNLKLRVGPLSVKEVRDRFLGFFRRKGHEVIEPYPVLARWRDDLYLTIASIVVFQPHVTSGIVEPPANPLVIAQPCIRLEDIDKIGYTFGRHLTNFIMGGHHAFNYPNKFIYFTHETAELAREFFVDELGVPEDELTFKESWWEGGGNAGPCFEVCVGGLEVATLVFMMYEVRDGNYVEMPLKIVDTGYGIERITWLTQKTPTAFHAVYGDLVNQYCRLLGIEEPPKELLFNMVKYVGRYSFEDLSEYRELKKTLAKELNMNEEQVSSYLDGIIRVFTLLDHVKTAMLMLSDGAVPSNTGEGYLVRLVLRRIFRLLTLMNKEDIVYELFKIQADYWSSLYPRIKANFNYIIDALETEFKRYRDLLKRAPSIISKYVRRKKVLTTNDLIELYDSHGLPPDVVELNTKKLGIKIEVPTNFYSLVASRHMKAPIKAKKIRKLPDEVINLVKTLPGTKALFHEDPYIRSFRAKIIKVFNNYVVLDKTAFYPEGGGQESDRGLLRLEGCIEVKVVDVQKIGNVIVHVVDRKLDSKLEGSTVEGIIDWERRYSLMRHHTATHIILGAARAILGDHVWQAGAEKTMTYARLDIMHHKPLTDEEIKSIEDLANRIINEGREVKSLFLPRYEAEKRYSFRLYQGGVPLEPIIRVVEIPGHDAEACFGTHVSNTREVGAIKIIRTERIADGVVRLEYVAGTQLVNYIRKLEGVISEASKILGGDVVNRARSLTKELSTMKKYLSSYRKAYLEVLTKELLSTSLSIGKVKLVIYEPEITDNELLRNLLLRLIKLEPKLVVLLVTSIDKENTRVEVSLGSEACAVISALDIVKVITSKFNGKGGGKKDHAVCTLPLSLSKELKENIRKLVVSLIKGGHET